MPYSLPSLPDDADGTRFLVEMQREPQDFFYERAVFNASHCVIRQMEKGEDEYDFPAVYFIGLVDFPLHKDPDRALSPQATILDNFCFSLHNMQFLEERPAELRQEIFELLFETAEIATFTPEDKVKYEFDMTTERDIRNQIRFAEKQASAQAEARGEAKKAIETARRLKQFGVGLDIITQATGLTEEQVRGL